MLLLQVNQPLPGQEIYWFLGILAAAIPVLFWALIKAKDQLAIDWKGIAEKATTELTKTIESLRSITDAVEKGRSDHAAALERNSQMMIAMAAEVHKIAESQARMERQLEWNAERDRAEGHRRSKGGDASP